MSRIREVDIFKWEVVGQCEDLDLLIDAYLEEKQTSVIFMIRGSDASQNKEPTCWDHYFLECLHSEVLEKTSLCGRKRTS